jgi:four helix bundle protein
MFLTLNHQKLDVYIYSKEVVVEIYKYCQSLPDHEKFGLISQIRRAAISVHLNIAEGCSRRSALERKRFFEISRGSLIEIDAALDIADSLNYNNKYAMENLSLAITNCFRRLTGLIASQSAKV